MACALFDENADGIADTMGANSIAIREQGSGVGQVGAAVPEMDQATQQSAVLVEQTALAAFTLRGMANCLATK